MGYLEAARAQVQGQSALGEVRCDTAVFFRRCSRPALPSVLPALPVQQVDSRLPSVLLARLPVLLPVLVHLVERAVAVDGGPDEDAAEDEGEDLPRGRRVVLAGGLVAIVVATPGAGGGEGPGGGTAAAGPPAVPGGDPPYGRPHALL